MTPEGAGVSGFLRPQAERVLGARGAAPRRLHSTQQRRLRCHTTPTGGHFFQCKAPRRGDSAEKELRETELGEPRMS